MENVEITIIGAGVIGLAVAERLSKSFKSIFVIEKEDAFGRATSSRNSEVIHTGIYYPSDSLKAKTCVEGNRMLYELCEKQQIPHKKLGKLIVATCKEEIAQVEKLFDQGKNNGVMGLDVIDSSKIRELEPNIKALCALFSPESGIIDSHRLMDYFSRRAKENGAGIVYQSQARGIEKRNGKYGIEVQDNSGETFSFNSEIVINAAGLYSDSIAKMVGIDIEALGYNLKYCKGEYFRSSAKKSSLIQRLIYPVPEQRIESLGIHLTPDIYGQVRLGPDAEYLKENMEDYKVNENKQRYFVDSIIHFAPFIDVEDIHPDTAGIRPKLQGPNDSFRDFVIKEESDNGFPGFINLIGIESPGLTSALSIARIVENLLPIHKN